MTAQPRPALLLVTGSRSLSDHGLVNRALDIAWQEALGRSFSELVVVHGGAKGADTIAQRWAERRQGRGVHWRRFPAEWDGPCTAECKPGHRRRQAHGSGSYCPSEGSRRNQRMVEHVTAQAVPGGALCLAFFLEGQPCRGTHDCLRRIMRAGLPFRRFTQRQAAVR
jgi:hypothetical protein